MDPGIRWIRIEREETRNNANRPLLAFNLRVCRHCDDPACLAVCPSEAIMKRSDGVVLVDAERCIGCEQCVDACPYGAMTFDSNQEIASKCDLCSHRLKQNDAPRCVAYCQGKAIAIIDEENLKFQKEE